MSLNEKVALQQALDDVPESDRRVAYGNLLIVTLVAFRQVAADWSISAHEKMIKTFEQEMVLEIASILAKYLKLSTPLLEVGDVNFNDVRRDLLGLRQQLLCSTAVDDLLHLLETSFSGKLDRLSKSWEDMEFPDIQDAMIRALHPESAKDDGDGFSSDEELLAEMREDSGGFAERVRRALNSNVSENRDAV